MKTIETKTTKATANTPVNFDIEKAKVVLSPIQPILKYCKMDVGQVKGLLQSANLRGVQRVITDIPVELMYIDKRYQTDCRTERDMGYLVNG